jgi:hypothetical protein
MHTIRQNHYNVLIRQMLHATGLTDQSSGSAQLHKTIARLSTMSSMQQNRRNFVSV